MRVIRWRQRRNRERVHGSGGTRLRAFALAAALLAAALLGLDIGDGLPHVKLAAAQEAATSSPGTQDTETTAAAEQQVTTGTATRTAQELLESIRATATVGAELTVTAAAEATNLARTPTVTPTPSPTHTHTPTPTPTPSPTPTPGPDEILEARIDDLIGRMSVADKVGQLFVVTFQGNDLGPRSDVAELIEEYRVGGVVLSPRNRNFSNYSETTPEDVARLTNQLQALAYGIYLAQTEALNVKEGGPAIQEFCNLVWNRGCRWSFRC